MEADMGVGPPGMEAAENDGAAEHRFAGWLHDDVVTPHRRRSNARRRRAGPPAPSRQLQSHHILLGAN